MNVLSQKNRRYRRYKRALAALRARYPIGAEVLVDPGDMQLVRGQVSWHSQDGCGAFVELRPHGYRFVPWALLFTPAEAELLQQAWDSVKAERA